MRIGTWVVLSAALFAVGCVHQGECEGCGDNETCDAELNVCVLKSCNSDTECGDNVSCTNGTCQAAGNCPGGCAVGQACVSGDICEEAYASISIVAPIANATIGAQTELIATLVERPNRSSPNPPETLAFTSALNGAGAGASGTLTRQSNGQYTGTYPTSTSGAQTITVAFPRPAVPSASVSVTADLTPPVITLVIPPHGRSEGSATQADETDDQLPQAYRRDDVVSLQIEANRVLRSDSIQIVLAGLENDGGFTAFSALGTPTPVTPCSMQYCAEVSVDLSKPKMNAFRGEFPVYLVATDSLGNAGTADGGIPVTRWKWNFDVSDPVRGTPAVAPPGNVVFATTNAGTSGEVYAVSPSGTLLWSRALGAIEASIAVGGSDAGTPILYVASNESVGAAIYALQSDGGTILRCPDLSGGYAGNVFGSPAIGESAYDLESSASETAFAVVNTAGRLVAVRPFAANTSDRCLNALSAGRLSYPAGVVSSGDNIFYPDGRLLRSGTFTQAGVQVRGDDWPVDAGVNAASGIIVDNKYFVSGTFGPLSRIVSANASGVVLTQIQELSTGPFAISAESPDTFVFGSETPTLERLVFGAGVAKSAPTLEALTTTPVIVRDGGIFAAGGDVVGTLVSFDSTLTETWHVTGLGRITGSMSVDCNRDGAGAVRVGESVLYIPSTAGSVFAVIVEGRGLEPSAPWPKYQHDPRNTGNATTSLSEFACP